MHMIRITIISIICSLYLLSCGGEIITTPIIGWRYEYPIYSVEPVCCYIVRDRRRYWHKEHWEHYHRYYRR